MKTAIVYTTPPCPYCKFVINFLEERGVRVTAKDVANSKKNREEMFAKAKVSAVPVTVIGNTVIIGYDTEKLEQAIK